MIFKSIISISLFSLTAMYSVETYAEAKSYARIGPISVQLTDLNQLDGITPSLVWYSDKYPSPVISGYVQNFTGQYSDDFSSGIGLNELKIVEAHLAGVGSAGAAYLPSTSLSTLQGSGFQAFGDIQGEGNYTSVSSLTQNLFSKFSLTPFTAVTFSGLGEVFSSVTGSLINKNKYAEAELKIAIFDENSYCQSGCIDELNVSVNNILKDSFEEKLLSANFSNTTNNHLDGFISMYASTNGNINTAAVPEPETYAMILAGLGFVGRVSKNRKKL